MKLSYQQLITAAATTLLILVSGTAAQADDTEVFNSGAGTGTRPNIMLIIDNSYSMTGLAEYHMLYDKNFDFSDGSPPSNCPTDRIYWSTTSTPPSCTSTQWVANNYFVCQKILAGLTTTGYSLATTGVGQWEGGGPSSTKKWKAVAAGNNDDYVECYGDYATAPFDGIATDDNKGPANGTNGGSTGFNNNAALRTDLSTFTTPIYFFTGNYVDWYWDNKVGNLVKLTRLQVVQGVAKNTVENLHDVNVGLMTYSDIVSDDSQGGYVLVPVDKIENNRTALMNAISALDAKNYTPLSETMYEAYLYWAGKQPDYGSATSVAASRVSATGVYKTPLTACPSSNFNVLLTDGDPTKDRTADSKIKALPGFVGTNPATPTQCSNNGVTGTPPLGSGAVAGDGRCLDDITSYMFNHDLFDDPATTGTNDPVDIVKTFTIGFGPDVSGSAIVAPAATNAGGIAYDTSDSATLTAAFNDISKNWNTSASSFTAPAVSVNAFNRTHNLNDLFIAIFKPTGEYHWPGNLKKYRLQPDGSIFDDSSPTPMNAVDPSTGFFYDTAQSYWSAAPDGARVQDGGAANKLPTPATTARNVYTDIGALSATPTTNLTATANLFGDSNASITNAMLGLPGAATATDRTKLINWALGADVDDGNSNSDYTEQRYQMGDPLHARPASLVYSGTAASPVGVVYSATNDGYLHAIDPSTGIEKWAFIPSELIPRMYSLYLNAAVSTRSYGLDGNVVIFKLDRNSNGIVDIDTVTPANSDRVLLLFGMGRGGSNYYALDVTDPNVPKFLWKVGDSTTPSLPGLGQTWSTPVVARVNVNTASQTDPDKLVVIFGGGYDTSEDNNTPSPTYHTDSEGNRIFMLDAKTGAVLWHAGPTNVSGLGYDSTANFTNAKFTNSIPGDIRVIDMDSNGFADRMYASDTGGHVWRFDITNGNAPGTASSTGSAVGGLVTGGVIASLGAADLASPTVANNRKFYYAPDASLVKSGSTTFVNIAIGSGYRGHPLDTSIHDSIYSLRDANTYGSLTQAQYDAITPIQDGDATLIDVTTSLATVATSDKGWKIRLRQSASTWVGEKVLAEATTFNGAVLFTTYTPPSAAAASCNTSGANRLYAMKVLDSKPYVDRDASGTFTVSDRAGDLKQGGIASQPQIFFPSPDASCTGAACSPPPTCKVGVENCFADFTNRARKTLWTQKKVDATN